MPTAKRPAKNTTPAPALVRALGSFHAAAIEAVRAQLAAAKAVRS